MLEGCEDAEEPTDDAFLLCGRYNTSLTPILREMVSPENHQSAAKDASKEETVLTTVLFITMFVVNIVSGQTVSCNQAEYQTGNECCPMCLPGSRVRTDCTEFRSTSCLACLERTYMNKPTGLKQCFPCTNCDTASGLKTKTSCTTTSDSVCEPLEGFYCVEPSDNDCDAAKRHRRCEPGQFISKKGTASSDSECSACSQGTFSDGSFTSCRPHTQ